MRLLKKAFCLILISTIFKTINSSVDNTRKTLALFNKDWNTYKTNWQTGFSQNGVIGGVKSMFQPTSSVISSEQVQMLRNWNNAVKHGCTNQETFNKIIANADDNTKMYFDGLNKGKGTLDGLKNAQNATKASTIGLTIAQTALNMAISMGFTAAISLVIKELDKMINHAKRASEAADEAFEETSDKVHEQQEDIKTLDELISKYKELKKDGNLDIEGRKEVKELQNNIADLVGTQAKNLDLVNGKLDDEIKKLDEISEKEAKTAYETATANYNNSQRANQNATGDDSWLFVDGYAYTGEHEKEAEEILKEYGFVGNIQSGGFFGNTLFVSDTHDNDGNMLEGAQEKANYLQSMIDVLEQNGQRATKLYAGLISQRDKYLSYIDNQQNAASTLVNSWIIYSQYSNEELSKVTIDSVESFESYRQKMIDAAKNDESIGKMLSDGTLSEKDLETAINNFMATSTKFSYWYEQWSNSASDEAQKSVDKITSSFDELSKSIDEVQSAYETVSSVMREYNETGIMTVDSLQSLLSLDNKYLAMLFDENGQLDLTSEALKRHSIELIRNMTLKKMADYVSYIDSLGVEAAKHLLNASAIQEETQSYEEYIKTLLMGSAIFGELNETEQTNFANQLMWMVKVSEASIQNWDDGSIYKDSADKAKQAAEAREDYAEKVADLNEQLAEKEEEFAEKMQEAWEKEHLKSLKETLEERADILDRYSKRLDVIDWGEGIIGDSDYETKLMLLSDKMATATEYAGELKEEFEYLAGLTPATGEEAQEIAGTIEDIGSKMRDNISVIRETAVEIQKARISRIAEITDNSFNALEHEAQRVEALINVLKNKNKDSYTGKYTEDLLLADTMFSALSTTGSKALKKQKEEDKLLIEENQKTQDEINEIVTKALNQQIADNKKAREKERQELIDDMEETRKDIQKQLDEAAKDYAEKMEDLTSATTKTAKSISDIFGGMIDGIQSDVDGFSAQNIVDELNRLKESSLAVEREMDNLKNRMGVGTGLFSTQNGYINPVGNGTVSSNFGTRSGGGVVSPNHQGMDIAAPTGATIVSIAGGKVTSSEWQSGYGNTVEILMNDGNTALYAHMVQPSALEVGDTVNKGSVIGYVGSTGNSTGSHLHLGIKNKDGNWVDPKDYIPGYAVGTDYAPGGTSIVGEDGRELIVTPDGNAVLADEPAIVDLPQGSRVIPNEETEELIENGSLLGGGRYIRKNGVNIPNPNYVDPQKAITPESESGGDGSIESVQTVASDSENSLKLSGGAIAEGVTLIQTPDGLIHIIGMDGLTAADFGDDITFLTTDEVAKLVEDPVALENIKAQHTADNKAAREYTDNQIFSEVEGWINESNKKILNEYAEKTKDWDTLTDDEKLARMDEYQDFLWDEKGKTAKKSAKAALDLFLNYMARVEAGLEIYDPEVAQQYMEAYQEPFETAREAEEYFSEKRQTLIDDALSDLDDYASRLSEELTAVNEHLSKQIEKQQALLDIKSKEFEVINDMTSAQREIDKAIASSRIATEYLDEETRKRIFNEEDYEKLSSKISSITRATLKLSESYAKKIKNLSEDELYKKEEITAEYEHQLSMKQRELEIAQAEVDLRQKEEQLANVLEEKNVRIRKDGEWVWTYNQDNLRQATEDLADAKAKLADAQTQKSQQSLLDIMQRGIDSANTTIGKNEQQMKEMEEVVKRVKAAVSDMEEPLRGIDSILEDLEKTGLPAMDDVVTDVVGTFSKILGLNVLGAEGNERATAILPDGTSVGLLMKNGKVTNKDLPKGTTVYTQNGKYTVTGGNSGNYSSKTASSKASDSSDVSYVTATTPEGTEIVAHIKNGKTVTEGLKAGTVVHTGGGDYVITGGSAGKYSSKKVENKYASGTDYTKSGLTLMGENGEELFIEGKGHLIPINEPIIGNIDSGGIVFNQSQMNFARSLQKMSEDTQSGIYNIANNRGGSVVNYNMYGNALFDGNNPEEIFKQLADFMTHNRYKS